MSWLPDLFSDTTDAQSFGDAQANYSKLQVTYAAQLQKRLNNGEISQAFFEAQMASLRDTLIDPSGEAWAAFNAEVALQVKNLPATVQNAVTDTANWVGTTVGKTVSGVGGGLFGGLVSNTKFVIGSIIGVIVLVLIWKPVVKPLLNKILFIPI